MRSPKPLVSVRTFASFSALLALASPGSAQILNVDSDSITTYLQASSTTVQGVRPLHLQRIVNVEGTQRASAGIPVAIAGNPGENAWRGTVALNGVMLATGAYSPTDIDISLPTKGFPWVIGRAYSAVQVNSSSAAMDSNGYQGQNWFQLSQPELVLHDDADNSKDTLYLVLGPDRFAEFKRASSSSNQFSGRNGATGCFQFQAGVGENEPDLYVLTDTRGTEFTFFGFDADAGAAKGCLWKTTDADSNSAFVGDFSSKGAAITNGYDTAGRIKVAFDASDRRFTYSYTTLDSVVRLTQVKAETKSGGTWASPTGVATVAQVDYAYYTTAGSESWGESGDLKQVTLTRVLSDGTTTQASKKHYRYWEGTYNSSTNAGHPHALMYVFDFEGVRRFDWNWGNDHSFDDDHLGIDPQNNSGADFEVLKKHAAAYFEYDSSHRVRKAWFNGSCGRSGGADGNTEFSYVTNLGSADPDAYEPEPRIRTVVKRPDGSYLSQYFDETGQALSQVITDGDPSGSPAPSYWATRVLRDANGCVSCVATPEVATAYTHSTGAISWSATAGLVQYFTRDTSTNTVGFLTERRHGLGLGTNGDGTNSAEPHVVKYLDEKLAYDSSTLAKTITDVTVRRAVVTSRKVYPTETSSDTGGEETTYSYTAWSGASLSPEKIDVTPPVVSTTKNGSGSANVSASHLRKDGLVDFEKRPLGSSHTIAYTAYTNGQVTRRIEDANTSSGDVTGLPSSGAFNSAGGSVELHKKTDTTYTASGLRDEVQPAGSGQKIEKAYTTKLADERLVVLNYAAYSGGEFYGPVGYQVVNQAGKAELSGVIGISGNHTSNAQSNHIVEGDTDPNTPTVLDADPIQAVGSSFGSVQQMTTFLFDESGTRVTEERRYFLIPSSGEGTVGTNFDATKFGYDDEGHRVRVKEPSGTIRRTTYDLFDRVVDSSIGTNDADEAGTDNMVVTEHLVYDGDTAGKNGRLTSRTAYVEDGATGARVTTYSYDARGRRLLEAPPVAPFTVTKFDNLNRAVAVGVYGGTTAPSASTDPTATTSTNRMSLSETLFDEAGRAWKTIRHKIDPADGSDDDTLEALTWHDSLGRTVKSKGSGGLVKTRYDRLGRATDEFVLAKDNDTAYADADDVAGDIVMEQHQTRFDPVLDTVVFTATISRKSTDYSTGETTGELDTNADGVDRKLTFGTTPDVKGRMQVTGYWYDLTKRQTERVEFGTNGDATLDFTTGMSSAPTRSDTALRTSTVYNFDGTVDTVEDPRGLKQKTVHDHLGRVTKEIRNYKSTVNSGNPSGTDVNQTVLWGYTNGLRTSMTADMPSGQDDQVTTYTFGTTKGSGAGDSKIATGHLVQKETYPDSVDSSDVKTFAYNAQSEEIWRQDQAGNVIEVDLDARGRQTARRVTTLASGFDGAVRRITTSYDGLGRIEKVTQYDSTSGSTNILDQVQYTYEGWGHVSKFEQDRDGYLGESGSINDYEVSYTYSKLTSGRNAILKTQMVLPGGDYVGFAYLTSGGLHDGEIGRVTSLFNSSQVQYARYRYNGVGQVVGTEYLEPQVMSNQYSGSGTSATYPDLDLFNRVVKSRWTKDLSTDVDLYHSELEYDRNSNITSAEDMVHLPFSVEYAMDDLDRLEHLYSGTFSGGSLDVKLGEEDWTLSHTGNWDHYGLDLNGDGDYGDAEEENDTRSHNEVNEITARTGVGTITYDPAGNLTNDGQDYTYVWDAFGRLRKVQNRDTTPALIAEYQYNGLGYRLAEHVDTDEDGDVDGSDLWYFDAFDKNWRQVARFRSNDTSPKEQFVAHQAGLDGRGGSSYIDLVAVRNKDADTDWTAASDGVLEERIYYCQNQHADVIALINSAGEQVEMVRYSAYGVPFGLPAGDTDSDGDCDGDDESTIRGWSSGYDVRADLNIDGTIDSTDEGMVVIDVVGGREVLSCTTTASRRGTQGSEYCVAHCSQRNRVFSNVLGSWLARDFLEYVDGSSLYHLLVSNPSIQQDPDGLNPRLIACLVAAEARYHMCTALGLPGCLIGYELERAQCYDDWNPDEPERFPRPPFRPDIPRIRIERPERPRPPWFPDIPIPVPVGIPHPTPIPGGPGWHPGGVIFIEHRPVFELPEVRFRPPTANETCLIIGVTLLCAIALGAAAPAGL